MCMKKEICKKCKGEFLADYKKSESSVCPDCQPTGPIVPTDTLTYQKKGINRRLAAGFSVMGSSGDR